MRNLFCIIFLFLSCLFFRGESLNFLPYEVNVPVNYIQNNYTPNIVLTSENLNQNVIIKNQSDDQAQIFCQKDFGTCANAQTNKLNKNNPQISRGNSDDLKICLNTEVLIRAP